MRDAMMQVQAIGFLCAAAFTAFAQTLPEDQVLQSMFEHGLSQSAIAYSTRQRSLSADPAMQAKWAMRQMECYAQAALWDSQLDSQYWDACDEILDEFKSENPQDARMPWLEWQSGRCRLLRSQAELAGYLAAPSNTSQRDRALALVREILNTINDLEDDVRRRQPLATRQVLPQVSEAPAAQLAKLQVDAGLLRCEALLIRARLYPTGSPDRIAAATEVDAQAARILDLTDEAWDSRSPLMVAQAAAQLDLGQPDEGLLTLTRIAQEQAPSSTATRAAVVAIEYLAAHGSSSRAQALLSLLESAGSSAEYELARMQIELADLNRATTTENRESRLQSLLDRARQIGEQHGSYWRNRADALLTGISAADSTHGDVSASSELITIEIRQLLAAGKDQAAIEKLLQHRDNATSAGSGKQALELATQAAALLLRQEDWLAAADAAQITAVSFQHEPGAAALHARGIYAISQALRTDAANQSLSERYEAALIDQLKYWPDAAESDVPQEWLALWMRGRGRSAEFLETLLARAARCHSEETTRAAMVHWLTTVLDLNSREQLPDPILLLEQRIETNEFQQPHIANVFQLAALAFHRWPDNATARRIDSELASLLSSANSESERLLLVAISMLRMLQQELLSEAIRVGSQQKPADLDPKLLSSLAPAYLAAIDESNKYSPKSWLDALGFDASIASSLIAESDPLKKAAGYRIEIWTSEQPNFHRIRDFARAHPRNGQVQLQLTNALAGLRSSRESAGSLIVESNRIARLLIGNSVPGSELNLGARWRLVKNQLMVGEQGKAATSAQLLLASQPLDSAVWQSRFEGVAKLQQ